MEKKLTQDEMFQRLGEKMNTNGWDMKPFAVASEVKDYLRNMNDHNTDIEGFLNILTGGIILRTTINEHIFNIAITYSGEKNKDGEPA